METEDRWADSALPADCLAWIRAVDVIMKRDWFIDSDDAGLSEEDVLRFYASGESPEAFVERFAIKYDLLRFDQFRYLSP